MPTRALRQTGDRFVREIAAIDGDVYIPSHGYLALLAGKKPYTNAVAAIEVVVAADAAGRKAGQEITAAIEQKKFAAIVLNDVRRPGRYHFESHFRDVIERSYQRAGTVPADGARFPDLISGNTPRELHLPKP